MSGAAVTSHPFVYGLPVQGSKFLDRENELRAILNRLSNGDSTAVFGEPHIGKTSLLFKLADELSNDAQHLVVFHTDLQPIENDYTPVTFWEEALHPLQKRPGHAATSRRLEKAAQDNYNRRSLERLFSHLYKQGRRLVLLLDEFERLIDHPNFQNSAFFPLLRSLASRTGGLALIIASRLSIAEMNERGRKLLRVGSPLFNYFGQMRLRPFDEKTVNTLLGWAGDALSPDERHFIRQVAGYHPYLLQAMAATLLETKGDDRQARAAENFYERISFHFDDLWDTLDNRTRTTGVILSLIELGKRALGQKFACGEIEKIKTFGPELCRLAERGLAKRAEKGWKLDLRHLLLWQGERWTVGTQAFAWWVRDVVIAEARQLPAYEEWLANKRYRSLLTQEQWSWLIDTVRNAPKSVVQGIGALARAIFEELTERK